MNESSNQFLPIIFNLIAAVLGAGGQVFYKIGASRLGHEPIYKNWPIALGALLFVGVMGFFVAAFKLGGNLSVTYPVYATTFFWGLLIAKFYLGENISIGQVAGVILIVAGVATVGYFGARTH